MLPLKGNDLMTRFTNDDTVVSNPTNIADAFNKHFLASTFNSTCT